jgi:hypothetical protein
MYQNVEEILHMLRNTHDMSTRKHLAMALRRVVSVATAVDIKGGTRSSSLPNFSLPSLTVSEIEAGKNIGRLEAIKLYKNRTGESLMDSKRAVENHFNINALDFNTKYNRPLPPLPDMDFERKRYD